MATDVRAQIRQLLTDAFKADAEAAELRKQIEKATAALQKRLAAVAEKASAARAKALALAPWPEDTSKDERPNAFFAFEGIGTLRRVWVKGKREVNFTRLLEHVDKDVIDACTDTQPETSRVQFYPERNKA